MIYTDKHGTEIKKGSIVSYNDQNGEMRRKYEHPKVGPTGASTKYTLVPQVRQGMISRINSKWANISSIFGGRVYDKKVPLTELTESADQFYERWRQSETYRCM